MAKSDVYNTYNNAIAFNTIKKFYYKATEKSSYS